MGNRILKERIIQSDEMAALSFFERLVFINLILTVDDYGICKADPMLLSRILFPRDSEVNEEMMAKALEELENQGLIFRYRAGKGVYLKLVTWEKHQRLRSSHHKFPVPEGEEGKPEQTEKPAEAAQEAEKSEAVPAAEESAEIPAAEESGGSDAAEVRELPVVELPLNNTTTYSVMRAEADEYARLYPAVDVDQELRNMRGWCLANPQRRKTRNGVKKFITSWLARKQDRGGGGGPGGKAQPLPENPFIRMAMEDGEGGPPGSRLFESLIGKEAVQ